MRTREREYIHNFNHYCVCCHMDGVRVCVSASSLYAKCYVMHICASFNDVPHLRKCYIFKLFICTMRRRKDTENDDRAKARVQAHKFTVCNVCK